MGKSILVYITEDDKRVLGGDPLTLLVKDPGEQKQLVATLGQALKADTIRLVNGDYVLIVDEGKGN